MFGGAPECNLQYQPGFADAEWKHRSHSDDDHQFDIGFEPAMESGWAAGNSCAGLPRRGSVPELCPAAPPRREAVVDTTWLWSGPSWGDRIDRLRRRVRRQVRRRDLHSHGDRDVRLTHGNGYLQSYGAIAWARRLQAGVRGSCRGGAEHSKAACVEDPTGL